MAQSKTLMDYTHVILLAFTQLPIVQINKGYKYIFYASSDSVLEDNS